MKTVSLKIDDAIFSETEKILARKKNHETVTSTKPLNITTSSSGNNIWEKGYKWNLSW